MKKLLILLFVSTILTSCYVSNEDVDVVPFTPYNLTLVSNENTFNIKTNEDLISYAFNKMNLSKDKIITTVFLESAKDSQGDYYLVKGKYTDETKNIISFGIPLNIIDGNPDMAQDGNCTMTCNPQNDCNNGCEQVIQERCKRQSCSCSMSTGSSKSSISFNE
jgi:hypothetical protein